MSKKKKKKSMLGRMLKIMFLLLLAIVLYVGIRYGSVLIKYKNMAEKLVAEGGQDVFTESLTTLVYDADGNEIMELNAGKSTYYLSFDEIPYMARQIFVTVEDRKFYEHSGIDFFAVARAAVALVQNQGEITQGGSTITQQLARNIYLSHEVSAERKLKEMFIAWEIEKKYSKDKILEFYINDIYFSNGYYGLEAASRGYFGRGAGSLSLSELAFICAIPNNPTLYDPLINFDNTVKRRDRVLKQLYEQGCINQDTYLKATKEEIQLSVDTADDYYNYVETFVRYSATVELMRMEGFQFRNSFDGEEDEAVYDELYGEKYAECNKRLFSEGYEIYTSIDMELQMILQNALDNNLALDVEKGQDGIYAFQGSATCIDNQTGYVCAVVGGRSQPEYKGYTLNRAYQSFRQPGSAIKPILVYAPMFERGNTPETIVRDEKTEDGPVNADWNYGGDITIQDAITYSKNTIPWNAFKDMGYAVCIRYLLDMNFSHIVDQDYTAAMSIGGMTYGVSTVEMASAYATVANNGTYRIPTCIVKIKNKFGDTIYDESTYQKYSKQIYEVNATMMLTDCMKHVLAEGTARNFQISNAICAAKTGTTNENRDSWLVGYSKYYTTAVWCGYDMPREMNMELVRAAGNTWKQAMEAMHESLEIKDFDMYQKVEQEKDENREQDTEAEGGSIEETTEIESETTEADTEAEGGSVEESTEIEGGTIEENTEPESETTESDTEPEGGMIEDSSI